MPEKTAKPARKRATSRKTSAGTQARGQRGRSVEYQDIATRAYFISLDEGHDDDLANWLRAERELTAA